MEQSSNVTLYVSTAIAFVTCLAMWIDVVQLCREKRREERKKEGTR
jgi:hypothetical protein